MKIETAIDVMELIAALEVYVENVMTLEQSSIDASRDQLRSELSKLEHEAKDLATRVEKLLRESPAE